VQSSLIVSNVTKELKAACALVKKKNPPSFIELTQEIKGMLPFILTILK